MTKEAPRRTPDAYGRGLDLPDPVIVVGGQAVNLWAGNYAKLTEGMGPFVSQDLDVLGDRSVLLAIAKAAKGVPQIFPQRPPTNEVGVVRIQDDEGAPLLIEVLSGVHGVTNEALREPSYLIEIDERIRVKVPGPIVLLEAKLANAADIPQTDRQDHHHVAILVRLMPGYLNDLMREVLENRLTERHMTDYLEQLLSVLTSAKAKRVLGVMKLDATACFEGWDDAGLKRLIAFRTKRLPQFFGKAPAR